jgi:hypothetical protein
MYVREKKVYCWLLHQSVRIQVALGREFCPFVMVPALGLREVHGCKYIGQQNCAQK